MKRFQKIVEKLLYGEGHPGGKYYVHPGEISIGITTFEDRFDKYFAPLLNRIRDYTENEIIVAVNGEHNREFCETYRQHVIECIARHRKVYPVVFPCFRGLSKLWNSIIIHATHGHILMLNDDVMIEEPRFLENVCSALRSNRNQMYLINRSWSHFVVSRQEIDELGYFDERLLGIGEEDGDMTWRYSHRYGREIPSFSLKGFVNYAEETVRTYKPINIQTHSNTKYSLFNRKFMFTEKYEPSVDGIKGMFDEPVIMMDPGKEQYPNERFYRTRKKDL